MFNFQILTESQILQNLLNTYQAGFIANGLIVPDVSFGSEPYLEASALAQQLYILQINLQQAINSVLPDTAQDTDLQRIAAIYGLSLNPATPSFGAIQLSVSITTPIYINKGQQLKDSSGQLYQTIQSGYVSSPYIINIQSVDTGTLVNLSAGSTLTWLSLPPFTSPTATVISGLEGGAAVEGYEQLRGRLLARLQTAPGGGNWSYVQQIANSSLIPVDGPSIQQSFIYPCFNGPATTAVCIVSSPTITSSVSGGSPARDFGINNVNSINPYLVSVLQASSNQILYAVYNNVTGNMPEPIYVQVSTAVQVPSDCSIALALPQNRNNHPNWTDFNPFPVAGLGSGGSGTGYCDVSGAPSTTISASSIDGHILSTSSSSPSIITVASTSGFPYAGQFTLVDPITKTSCLVYYTGKTGTTFTGCWTVTSSFYIQSADNQTINTNGLVFNINVQSGLINYPIPTVGTAGTSAAATAALTAIPSNICWFSPHDYILYCTQCIITTNNTNNYQIQILLANNPNTSVPTTSNPPTNSGVFCTNGLFDSTNNYPSSLPNSSGALYGDWIFPAADNMENYVYNLLTEYASFGPGELLSITNAPGLFPFAYRRPLINDAWSSNVGPSILKLIDVSNNEVLDVQYLYRTNNGLCSAPNATVSNGPNILITNQIAFYPSTVF